MNSWTAYTLICISLIILTGFVFYLTGSFWTFLILIFIPNIDTHINADEEVGKDDSEESKD